MASGRGPWRGVAGVALPFAGYLAFLVFLTWPLGAHVATHLPHVAGTFVSDLYLVGWALAWQTHALLTDPTQFANGNIYGGVPRALFYGTPGFGLLPVYAPIFAATGNPTLALNGTILLNLAATATALHVVTRVWTGSELAGIAAGTTFAATKTALVMDAIMPHYAAIAAMPVLIWWLWRAPSGWRATVAFAALIAFQCATDVVYVALPIVLIVGGTAIARLVRPATRATGLGMLASLVLAGVALSPLYAGYLAVRADNPDLATQSIWRGTFFGWIDDRTGLPLGYGPLAFDPWAFLPLVAGVGAIAFGLVAVPVERARAWRHATGWFVTCAMIAWVIPLQYPSFRDLVLGSVVRDFLRLGLPALVAACLLVGLGFDACTAAARRLAPRAAAPIVAALLIVLVVAGRIAHAPYAVGDYPIEPAPTAEAEAPILRAGSGPVLVLPVGDPTRDSGSHATAMYRSIGVWRPLLNGYCSYYPKGFRERMNLVRRLPDAAVLDTLRQQTGLRNVVVHSAGVPELTLGRWRKEVEAGALPGVRIEHDDGEVMVLAVDPLGW